MLLASGASFLARMDTGVTGVSCMNSCWNGKAMLVHEHVELVHNYRMNTDQICPSE